MIGPGGVEDDGGRGHRAGEAAPAHLVDAGHTEVTGSTKGVLDVATGRRPRPGGTGAIRGGRAGQPALASL